MKKTLDGTNISEKSHRRDWAKNIDAIVKIIKGTKKTLDSINIKEIP